MNPSGRLKWSGYQDAVGARDGLAGCPSKGFLEATDILVPSLFQRLARHETFTLEDIMRMRSVRYFTETISVNGSGVDRSVWKIQNLYVLAVVLNE